MRSSGKLETSGRKSTHEPPAKGRVPPLRDVARLRPSCIRKAFKGSAVADAKWVPTRVRQRVMLNFSLAGVAA